MMKATNIQQMPSFTKDVGILVDDTLKKYEPLAGINSRDYRSLVKDMAKGIEEKLIGNVDSNEPVPLKEAERVFKKQMYLTALYDAYETHKDGTITKAAESLDYSREHLTREIKDLGIDTSVVKLGENNKTRADFKYFKEKILEELLLEKIGKYGPSLKGQMEDHIPLVKKDLTKRLNDKSIYQFYLNRQSFVYKIIEDVLNDKYEELKDTPDAYKKLQEEFRDRYLKILSIEANDDTKVVAEMADVSPRTVLRSVEKREKQ